MQSYVILYIQKMNGADTGVKNSLTDFYAVCTDFPFKTGGETKDLVKREWAGEDGEDVYIPSTLPLKAYDLEIEMCYKRRANISNDNVLKADLDNFRDFLLGGALKIYNPATGIGRQNVYLSDFEDIKPYKIKTSAIEMGGLRVIENTATFTVKFRVSDPRTDIKPSINNGVVTNLITA